MFPLHSPREEVEYYHYPELDEPLAQPSETPPFRAFELLGDRTLSRLVLDSVIRLDSPGLPLVLLQTIQQIHLRGFKSRPAGAAGETLCNASCIVKWQTWQNISPAPPWQPHSGAWKFRVIHDTFRHSPGRENLIRHEIQIVIPFCFKQRLNTQIGGAQDPNFHLGRKVKYC